MVLCSNTVGPCRCSFCTGKPVPWWRSCKENGTPYGSIESEAKASVVDPHWFQCGSGSGSTIVRQCGSGSRILMTKICNFTNERNPFFNKMRFSRGLHEGRPSYRNKRILQPSKRTSSISKHEISSLFSCFCGSFLPSWIRFQLIKVQDQC